MHAAKPSAILVLCDDADVAHRVAVALSTVGCALWTACENVPPGTAIDVVVTDAASAGLARQQCSRAWDIPARDGHTARPAVLGVGAVRDADVAIAAPPAEESVRLACSLLVEISRLRAEHEQADRAGRKHRELAYTDPLTGVANRRAWDESLAERSAANGWTGCLAIVDLDRFKYVNESCGIRGADQLLIEVAGALTGALRQDDLVARIGGDEFGVLLDGVSAAEAAAVLERLRAAVAGAPQGSQVTASIGYATATSAAPATLFAVAETALRDAKREGGNRVVGTRG